MWYIFQKSDCRLRFCVPVLGCCINRRQHPRRGPPGGAFRARVRGVQPREADAEERGAARDGYGQERGGPRLPLRGVRSAEAQLRRGYREGEVVVQRVVR